MTLRRPELLEAALTHPSLVPDRPLMSYERLEFLGDAVVGIAVSEYLYRKFSGVSEGELARRRATLVSREVLAEAARAMGLYDMDPVRRAMDQLGTRAERSVLAAVYEAVIGAIFLDSGYRTARRVVNASLADAYKTLDDRTVLDDPKTRLQQLTQAKWHVLPEYRVERAEGTDHQPVFTASVSVRGKIFGRGHGASKKRAQQLAAARALESMQEEGLEDERTEG